MNETFVTDWWALIDILSERPELWEEFFQEVVKMLPASIACLHPETHDDCSDAVMSFAGAEVSS